jgi:fructose-1,6-bisphosphatase
VLYECNPLAFITEQAGESSDGLNRIMEIEPQLCMNAPFFCGSYNGRKAEMHKAELSSNKKSLS